MFKTPLGKPWIQHIDSSCNLILPWYTDTSLAKLLSYNYKEWDVFEWGGGCSTVWYSHNCKTVTTLETNQIWVNEISNYLNSNNNNNFKIVCIDVPPSATHDNLHPNKDQYINYIETLNKKFDCIVVDGSYRNEALLISEKYIKDDGVIIFDNFEQNTSGYSVLPAKEYFSKYKIDVFVDTISPKWKTAHWEIGNKL